jgi:hypothetical protein
MGSAELAPAVSSREIFRAWNVLSFALCAHPVPFPFTILAFAAFNALFSTFIDSRHDPQPQLVPLEFRQLEQFADFRPSNRIARATLMPVRHALKNGLRLFRGVAVETSLAEGVLEVWPIKAMP